MLVISENGFPNDLFAQPHTAFLQKPFVPTELAREVDRALRGAPARIPGTRGSPG